MGPVGSITPGLLSSYHTAKNSIVNGVTALASREGSSHGEQIKCVKFATLEDHDADAPSGRRGQSPRPILLLGYANGFQAWLIPDGETPHEILSRREGPVRCVSKLRDLRVN